MAFSMEGVTIVSAHACTTVESPLFGLEIPNASLLCWKREGKNLVEEINKSIWGQSVALDVNCTRLASLLEKTSRKLRAKFSKAKGSWERNKINTAKTYITVGSGYVVNIQAITQQLKQAEVNKISVNENNSMFNSHSHMSGK